MSHTTREAWLRNAVDLIRPWFVELGATMPEYYVTVSYPATGAKGKAIGVCSFHGADGKPQLLIHPKLDDEVLILATLVHEMVHAVLGWEAQHGPIFKKLAMALGLAGKMTATVPSDELETTLRTMLRRLGPYPHSKLDGSLGGGQKKQTTRMIKVSCSHDPLEGYTVRTTRKWLDSLGTPMCPCHHEEMTES